MWDQHLTTLQASTACYGDSFLFSFNTSQVLVLARAVFWQDYNSTIMTIPVSTFVKLCVWHGERVAEAMINEVVINAHPFHFYDE
jgi:hypothetical protein